MATTIKMFLVIGLVLGVYFFSYQLQLFFGKVYNAFSKKIGIYSATREHAIQRYVYLHRNSYFTKFYLWVNEQLIAMGAKRVGITPFGYMLFWRVIAVTLSLIATVVLQMGLGSGVFFAVVLYSVFMVMTRVLVAERMEKREMDVMDAIDLIIPEIRNGVKNSILQYIDNFAPSLQADFRAFVVNIQDRGYSFADAMYILADNLGNIFVDFSQKAIFYENLGEPDMVDIFTDIVETNRLRRELRYTNGVKFARLKVSFIASSLITFGYFVFLMLTDEWSRNFFLASTPGRILLVVILLIVFGVLSYITTIKSRQL